MKKIITSALCVCLLSFNGMAQSVVSINTTIERAAKVFMASKAFIGASLVIYINGYSHFYNYGSTNKDEQQLPTANTLYGIGSITKTFNGLLLAKAVEEHKVKLDDDIRKYLDGDYPNLEYKGQPIKLFHLISHVSGLPMWLSDKAETPGYNRSNFYSDLHKVKLDTLPGVKFRYSNTAAQLLGYILEKIYQRPFEDLLIEKITGPLQMKNTRIMFTPGLRKKAAKAYTNTGVADPNEYNYMQGAGGIKSNVSDLLKYMLYQMNEKDPAVALSHKESWGFDMGGGNHYSCALNWQIVTTTMGRHRISQDGDLANCSAVITFCPETKTGIVLLTNSDNIDAVSKFADDVLKNLASAIYK